MSTGAGMGKSVVNIGVIRAADHATDRERFLMALQGGPIMPPDGFVLLAGEDGEARANLAISEFKTFSAWANRQRLNEPGRPWYEPELFITGGLSDPPRILGADDLRQLVLVGDIAPDRVVIDTTALNTHQQAVVAVDRAVERGWVRLMVIASAYHLPRAYLTFVNELQRRGLDRKIELTSMLMVDPTPWFSPPEGVDRARIELFDDELTKIERYDEVASYEDGLAYLKYWEKHEPEFRDGRREA